MKKFALILSLFLTGLAGLAQAQVAAPSLLPGHARIIDPEQFYHLTALQLDTATTTDLTFIPENPAAMQWNRNSEIGIGIMDSSGSYDYGAGAQDSDFSGQYAGLRWVGSYFSLAVETLQFDGASSASTGHDDEILNFAGTFQLFDVLAIGVSQNAMDLNLFIPAISMDFGSNRETRTYGVSLRLGGVFYLGYQSGEEDYTWENKTSSTIVNFNRKIEAYGIAYMGDGENPWHLEVYQIKKDGDDDGGNAINEEEETVIVIEAQIGNLLVGIVSRDGSSGHTVPAVEEQSVESLQFTLTWVIEGGIGFTVHREQTEISSTAGTTFTREIESTAFSLSYLF